MTGKRRSLETDVVQNGKSHNRPLVLLATDNTGKTGSYHGTTEIALVPEIQRHLITKVYINDFDKITTIQNLILVIPS